MGPVPRVLIVPDEHGRENAEHAEKERAADQGDSHDRPDALDTLELGDGGLVLVLPGPLVALDAEDDRHPDVHERDEAQ